MTTGTASLPVYESSAVPPTDPQNGQFFDNAGTPQFKNAAGTVYTLSANTNNRAYYGDGSDGAASFDGVHAVTGASGIGPYTLSRDVYYSSITVASGVQVVANGWRIFCTGTLTLNSTAVIGSGGGRASLGGTVAAPGGNGGNGNADGGGSVGGVGASIGSLAFGGAGGSSGVSGGSVSNGASNYRPTNIPDAIAGIVTYSGGSAPTIGSIQGGAGGGGGTGESGGAGNAGAPGGYGGTVVMISTQALTDSGSINSNGGNGGSGGTGTGGSGGGGGGVVILVYGSQSGWTGTITANGGAGGASGGAPGGAGKVFQLQG
jgi:hypothetical protein